ncbi:LysR family transcriptional regulator [Sphingobium sp. BHU LFT2]|uniref:LysR family transcriptional regulator n=1 Tax=Sphingobium sp. BHU LFT2 TaxID=2807634 RepID=UPI001BECA1C5|nr:LysR family transcriptional regulator [Sphingobium sp. BHU LFT2]MBT2246778.1 LysR family transcriptional regulator [Sphingobium sp. BHU LFT2]
MDIDLTRLRHILAIAKNRSFSKAAEELHITQPALSRSISTFEDGFGVQVFERSRSGVTPTALGTLIIAEAERVLRAASGFGINLKLYAGGEAGIVMFGFGSLMASFVLPSLAAKLFAEKPGLELRTMIGSPAELLPDLLADRIEVIVASVWEAPEDADLVVKRISRIPVKAVVRNNHPLAARTRATLADINGYPRIQSLASTATTSQLDTEREQGRFVCSNFHILKEVAMSTDSVWITALAFVAKDIGEGRLTTIDLTDFEETSVEIAFFSRRGRTLSPAALTIMDCVRAQLRALGYGLD